MRNLLPALLAAVVLLVAAAGCGKSKTAQPSPAPPSTTAASTQTTTSRRPATTQSTVSTPSALQAEPRSAATGDIPDNQVFITFRNAAAGYSIKYPEGWAQNGSGPQVTFRDKNNIVRIVLTKGPRPDPAQVRNELSRLHGGRVTSGPSALRIGASASVKVVYETESAPNAVTGKRVTLSVDRYYLAHAGRRAVVDLGTPKGVDNVDAYRLMIQSFRWR